MATEPHLTLDEIALQLGEPYALRDVDARGRDLAAVGEVLASRGAAVGIHELAGGSTEVVVCANDALGALSVIAGQFAAHGLDIRSADLFTLTSDPAGTARRVVGGARRSPSQRRLLLDIFVVAPPAQPQAIEWPTFASQLRSTLARVDAGEIEDALEQVIEGFAARPRSAAALGPLFPVSIEVEPGASATRLFIQAEDTPGFLFEFTAGLGALRANVVSAEIRTVGGETRDTFLLTEANGGAIRDPHRLEELRVAAVLIKHFTHLLPVAAEPAQALRQFGTLVRSLAARPEGISALGDLASPHVLETLAELLGVSRFLWEDFLRMQHANLFPVLAHVEALDERLSRDGLVEAGRDAVRPRPGNTEGGPRTRLNEFKDREMFRSDLRYITGRIGFLAFSRELSDVAEATVLAAATHAHRELEAQYGTPTLADGGGECGWAISALGKFGGRELGYASDIELLFVYDGAGETTGPTVTSNHEYFEAFVRLVRDSITVRQEGIFELDLRLRPYGSAGALATSIAAFAQYYSKGGAAEQFERMALVRLRPFAGSEATRERVRRLRDAFVYSGEPMDLAGIRHLRNRQATELTRAGTVNAKYSPGGVVDLEYFVQTLQIEVGATEPTVRVPGTLEAAELLGGVGALPPLLKGQLQEAYGFMRRLIDALRVVRGNAKDLAIPPADSRAFAYLARRMHFVTPGDLERAITVRMAFGRALWDRFAGGGPEPTR